MLRRVCIIVKAGLVMGSVTPHLIVMTHNVEPIAPALRGVTTRAHASILPDDWLADGWLAPPVAIPILLTLLIVVRALWLL